MPKKKRTIKKKPKVKEYPHFKVDMLGCKINVIFDKKWVEIAKKLSESFATDEDERIPNGMAIYKDRNYYILGLPKVADHVIYHECMHVLFWIIDDFGLELDVNNNELGAYLIEYLIEHVIEIKDEK